MGAATATLLLLAGGPSAQAQLGLHAGVSLGATNNNLRVRGAPVVDGEPEAATNEADGMGRTSLGAHYVLPGRRSTQVFDYGFSTYFYIQRTQSVSFANEVGWAALLNPTEFSQLDFTLRGSQGRTSDLDLFRGQALGGSEARPTGSESFLSLSIGENLRWELGPFWEFGQRVQGEIYVPTGASTSTTARTLGTEAQLRLDRVWTRDQAGLFVEVGQGRSSEVVFEEEMEGLTGYPARRANYGRVGLGWGHAYSDYWSTQLDAGLLGVQVPQIRDPFLDVGAGASVTHRTATSGTITLSAERGIDTNVYVGDVLLQNSVGLRVEQPFGHKEVWNLSGDVEYQHSQSLFVVDVKDRLQVLSTSAILSYDWSRRTRLLFELNFTYQDASAGLRNMLRTEPFSSHRTMFLISIEMHYPEIEDEAMGGGRRLGGRGSSSGLDDEPDGDLPGSADDTGSEDSGGDDTPATP